MTTAYDPQIVQKFIDRLYRQATTAVVTSTILGVLVGAGIGFALVRVYVIRAYLGLVPMGQQDYIGIVVGAAVLGVIGFLAGRESAFQLRLKAQTVMCQLKIEENTRKWLDADGRPQPRIAEIADR